MLEEKRDVIFRRCAGPFKVAKLAGLDRRTEDALRMIFSSGDNVTADEQKSNSKLRVAAARQLTSDVFVDSD
jgi:hypothetical protein